MMKKGLVFGIVVLFIGMNVIPSTATNMVVNKSSIISFDGNTLYVGGSGPNNYSTIQVAIDDANPGDTVFVYAYSSPYYENVVVDKSINLIGEDKDTTVIDGGNVGVVVYITADWVNISDFTIQYGRFDGIEVSSKYNTIMYNIISNQHTGIILYKSSKSVIIGNNISYNGDGIEILDSSINTIADNNISKNGIGIYLHSWNYGSHNNDISGNNILNNYYGIYLNDYSSSNTITDNNIISNNDFGIYLEDSNSNNTVYHNNFINNYQNALDYGDNIWDDGEYGNYWSDYEERYPDAKPKLLKPWMWNTPYEIPDGEDMCPLVKQWPKSLSTTTPRNKATNKESSSIPNSQNFMSTIIPSAEKTEVPTSGTIVNDGSLSGYVNDTSGNPIEGASVRVYFHETYEEDYSDCTGYYHVTNIPICYCMKNATCSKEGYKTEWVLLSIVEDTTHDFILTSNSPPSRPYIDGEKGVVPGVEFDYYYCATDPDGDDVRYIIDWGDGTYNTTDFYKSGETATVGHTYEKKDDYAITAIAIDIYGAEGDVGYYVPEWKNKPINSLLMRFLERFPLLDRLLNI